MHSWITNRLHLFRINFYFYSKSKVFLLGHMLDFRMNGTSLIFSHKSDSTTTVRQFVLQSVCQLTKPFILHFATFKLFSLFLCVGRQQSYDSPKVINSLKLIFNKISIKGPFQNTYLIENQNCLSSLSTQKREITDNLKGNYVFDI